MIKPHPYYGETYCTALYKSGVNKGKRCKNKAYYYIYDSLDKKDNKYVCGVHSKKNNREDLIKNPNAKEELAKKLKDRKELVQKTALHNKSLGIKGGIICSKFRMMKESPHVDGYMKVFPNFKHGNRKDGFGCKTLSPKFLGPINHGQLGLPVSLNLENFFQGAKCFASELDKKGEPSQDFYDSQIAMFKDPIPHRHKDVAKTIKGNKNICKFWVWKTKSGEEKHFTYFECRQFYCTFYERLAKEEDEFNKLLKYKEDGYNLQIIGYDGYDIREVKGETISEKLYNCYLDTSRPFGHELCLLSLLVLEEGEYPWRKFKTEEF